MRVLSRQETGAAARPHRRRPRPGDLLERLPQPDVVAWVHHGAGLAGWGEAVRVTLPAGEDRFTAGEKWLRSVFDAADVDDQVRVRGSGPVAFGSFTFDASSDGSVADRPPHRARPRRPRPGLAHHCHRRRREPGPPDPRLASRPPGVRPVSTPPPGRGCAGRTGSLPGPRWEQAVAEAVAAIKAGGLRKVVLARDLFAHRRRAHRRAGPAAQAGRPLPGLLHVRLRRHGRRHPRIARSAGTAARSARWSSAAPRRAATTRRRTRRSAPNCWPRRRTPRNTPTRSTRYARRSGRCATTLDSRAAAGAAEVPEPAAPRHPGPRHAGRRRRRRSRRWPWPRPCTPPPRSAVPRPGPRWSSSASSSTWTGNATPARSAGWTPTGNGEWGIALRCAQLSGRTARLFAGCGIVAGSDPPPSSPRPWSSSSPCAARWKAEG